METTDSEAQPNQWLENRSGQRIPVNFGQTPRVSSPMARMSFRPRTGIDHRVESRITMNKEPWVGVLLS